ncbi:hypothetical protein QAD02_007928 [Eretmocerus hayati]|uniref:Uncharacterized protein n=1 Tax=Eretmocerus hayati TaxID=131215 RepID=A0ACC2N6H0_9HYME|nr:hypothetical protein QAD02_007928 [Eretmocerus hayati]
MLPLRPRPTKTSQQRAENARKQSISDSSSATSRAPPKRGRKKGSKIEPPERPTNMSGGRGDLDGSTIAKRLRIRKGGPRTQIPILKSSRETTRDSSESLTSSDESEDQEFEEPPIPQRDKSFLPDLLDKGEESNSTNQSSELSDTEERSIALASLPSYARCTDEALLELGRAILRTRRFADDAPDDVDVARLSYAVDGPLKYGVLERGHLREVFMCCRDGCRQNFAVTVFRVVSQTVWYGVGAAGGGRFPTVSGSRMRVPVVCPDHGVIGAREYVCQGLVVGNPSVVRSCLRVRSVRPSLVDRKNAYAEATYERCNRDFFMLMYHGRLSHFYHLRDFLDIAVGMGTKIILKRIDYQCPTACTTTASIRRCDCTALLVHIDLPVA